MGLKHQSTELTLHNCASVGGVGILAISPWGTFSLEQ